MARIVSINKLNKHNFLVHYPLSSHYFSHKLYVTLEISTNYLINSTLTTIKTIILTTLSIFYSQLAPNNFKYSKRKGFSWNTSQKYFKILRCNTMRCLFVNGQFLTEFDFFQKLFFSARANQIDEFIIIYKMQRYSHCNFILQIMRRGVLTRHCVLFLN